MRTIKTHPSDPFFIFVTYFALLLGNGTSDCDSVKGPDVFIISYETVSQVTITKLYIFDVYKYCLCIIFQNVYIKFL